MQVDEQLISRLEHLSRLQLTNEERTSIKGELENILAMVEKLQEVEVEGIEPLVYVNEAVNRLRKDEITNQVSREAAVQNAPTTDGTYFQVPKVIDR